MATEKLFRIICYLKTMRLFSDGREQKGGGFSSLHLKPIRCVTDVLYVQSEACEIFSYTLLVQTHQRSSFSRLDVLLIGGFLFIALGIDVSLLLSRI